MNYNEMSAGREMDVAVAKAMGFPMPTENPEMDPRNSMGLISHDGWWRYYCAVVDDFEWEWILNKTPSTDISCAWEVLESLTDEQVEIVAECIDVGGWGGDIRALFGLAAEKAALAISRAILNAVA